MKKIERMKEIEKLWRSQSRETDWEQINWEPFTVEAHPFDLNNPRVEEAIDSNSPAAEGYYFWKWGYREEASGTLTWNWALLHLLYTWYRLPEDCDAPLFINETAKVVCIPNPDWAHSLALLFQHPDSVLLGLEHMDAEKEVREAREVKCSESMYAGHRSIPAEGAPVPVSADHALAFLVK